MDALPPLPSSVEPFLKAVDGLTMRDVEPPPVYLFGGNTRGLFESIARGAINETGVGVYSLDLSAVSVTQASILPLAPSEQLWKTLIPRPGQGRLAKPDGPVMGTNHVSFYVTFGMMLASVFQV